MTQMTDPTAPPPVNAVMPVPQQQSYYNPTLATVPPPPTSTPTDPVPVAEPGYTTTEFWLSMAGMVIGFLVSAGIFTAADGVRIGGLVTSAISIIGYGVSRGLRKRGTTA